MARAQGRWARRGVRGAWGARACVACGRGRSARGARGRQAGARTVGRAAGPAGCALGARSLFLCPV